MEKTLESRSHHKRLRNVRKVAKFVSQIPEILLVVIMIGLILDMFASTVFRYLFASPIYWAEEIGTIGLTWMTMLGIGVAIKRNAHFIMPTFKYSYKAQFFIALLVHSLVIVFGLLMLMLGFKIISLSLNTLSPALEINMVFVNGSAVVGGLLIIIYTVIQIIELLKGSCQSSYDS